MPPFTRTHDALFTHLAGCVDRYSWLAPHRDRWPAVVCGFDVENVFEGLDAVDATYVIAVCVESLRDPDNERALAYLKLRAALVAAGRDAPHWREPARAAEALSRAASVLTTL